MDIKSYAVTFEQTAHNQIATIANCESFADAKIRIMPDAHAGAGCVIGFTGNLGDKVVPNLVGVDIGCGMYAVPLSEWDLSEGLCRIKYLSTRSFLEIDDVIKRYIPCGFNVCPTDTYSIDTLDLHCADHLKNIDRLNKSAGTLGGGNHFIEIDADVETHQLWLVIHSGSRNLGLQVATYYQQLAVETCKETVPKGLEYLTGELKEQYIDDALKCTIFATTNRYMMAGRIIDGVGFYLPKPEDCFHTIHNYIALDGMIRKGAIDASKGKRMLIPWNMRDGAVIAIGKGNSDWNNSAPHGAGRIMSRSQAKKNITVEQYTDDMKAVFTTTANQSTLDEAPEAYKPYEEIESAIKDTADIVAHLKPVYNFKAAK